MSYILDLSHILYYWILKQLELFRAGTFSYAYSGYCCFHDMIILKGIELIIWGLKESLLLK